MLFSDVIMAGPAIGQQAARSQVAYFSVPLNDSQISISFIIIFYHHRGHHLYLSHQCLGLSLGMASLSILMKLTARLSQCAPACMVGFIKCPGGKCIQTHGLWNVVGMCEFTLWHKWKGWKNMKILYMILQIFDYREKIKSKVKQISSNL